MCTVVDMYNLYVIHHEMGHSEYAMQYRNQPDVFRDGANAGFHEAVGDTISLFVLTPNHMQKLGLLNETNLDAETKKSKLTINCYTSPYIKSHFIIHPICQKRWNNITSR